MVAKSKAIVEISLDDKDFKRKTGQATAGLESGMKNVGTAVLGVAAALGAVAAAKGAVDMLTTLTKKAIEVADSFEIMEKQLTTLTKSEGKAKAFFAAIKQFAMDTPYQVRDLAQSFNMLYPVFKDKTIPMLKLIGDTAAGTGRSFQDTGSAMMRMATGDWGIEIMRQLFLVKSEFGDIFGPNGELVGSQEEAFAKLEEILGDRFGGMMVGMMDTVQGKVSNLKDVLDSLGAAVGAELTPVTKEFLDVLIEVVKEMEETGELTYIAEELAGSLRENKDIIVDIINTLPDLVSAFGEAATTGLEIGSAIRDADSALGELLGTGTVVFRGLQSAVNGLQLALLYTVELLRIVKEEGILALTPERKKQAWKEVHDIVLTGFGPEAKPSEVSPAGMRGFAEVGEAPSDIEALISEMKGQGYEAQDIILAARGTRAEAYVERELTAEVARGPAKKPGAAPKKRKEKYLPTVEKGLAGVDVLGPEELAAAQSELAMAEVREKREAKRAAELKKYEDEVLAVNKAIGDSLAGSIVSAFRGADIKDIFIDRLAAGVEAALGDALARAFAKTALSQIPVIGPFLGAFLSMREGGVIKAQGGLTMLPARPGGWTFPWAGKWINAAEGGRPETLGVFPEGQRGRDLIMRELLPQFFPETQMVNRNTFSPNIDVTLRGTDPQSIGVAVRAEQGSVNRDHVQRRAA